MDEENTLQEQEGEYGSFLDLNLDEVPDLHAVPADEEYRLKIQDYKVGTSNTEKTAGQQYVLFYLTIEDEPDTKRVTEVIMLPSGQEDKETNNGRKRQMKAFLKACRFDTSKGFNLDELVGEELYAILGVEEDSQYGERNNIKRLVIPEG